MNFSARIGEIRDARSSHLLESGFEMRLTRKACGLSFSTVVETVDDVIIFQPSI